MDMKTFMTNQIREALKYKWYKGVEIGHDPGGQAVTEWIEKYAANYRSEYEKCLEGLLVDVMKDVEIKMKDICPSCKRPLLDKVCKTIIEEFTKKWFLEI